MTNRKHDAGDEREPAPSVSDERGRRSESLAGGAAAAAGEPTFAMTKAAVAVINRNPNKLVGDLTYGDIGEAIEAAWRVAHPPSPLPAPDLSQYACPTCRRKAVVFHCEHCGDNWEPHQDDVNFEPPLPPAAPEPPSIRVCCGDFAKCERPCTPRGRWLQQQEQASPEPHGLAEAAQEALDLIDAHQPLNTRTFSSRRNLALVVELLERVALRRAAGQEGPPGKWYPKEEVVMLNGAEWKLVPVEPTPTMLVRAAQVANTRTKDPRLAGDVYRAMLAAAPTADETRDGAASVSGAQGPQNLASDRGGES